MARGAGSSKATATLTSSRIASLQAFSRCDVASDYAAIRAQHLKDYGSKKGWRQSVLADKYSERTHFIYELLQNAEDAGATRVQFLVFEERLEVRHDGRYFNPRDVVAICA